VVRVGNKNMSELQHEFIPLEGPEELKFTFSVMVPKPWEDTKRPWWELWLLPGREV
jgi:hypothetical protein